MSVRESSAGGFLANMVVSKSTIRKIEEGNKVADTTDTTDTSLIVFNKKNNQNDVTDDLDKSGHTPYLEKDGLLFYEVSGSTFAGTMVVVTDPSRVFVGTSGDYKGEAGIKGQLLSPGQTGCGRFLYEKCHPRRTYFSK